MINVVLRRMLPVLMGLVMCSMSYAQQKYAASLIPDSLIKDANIVVREYAMTCNILSKSKMSTTTRYAYTIMNEFGDQDAVFFEFYDKTFDVVTSISGSLYDSHGNEIKQLKSKTDVQDLSGSGDNFTTDSRIKRHNFSYRSYPYTVVYEVKIETNGTFMPPGWMPQYTENMSIQHATFDVDTPPAYELRWKTMNCANPKVTETTGGGKHYSWSCEGILARKPDFSLPEWSSFTPTVFLAPVDFEIQGYSGSMNTWKDFGAFVQKLRTGRQQLPPQTIQKVHEITDQLSDDKQKAEALYRYMQSHTRYVSIQLGIGGWQPFDATFVATKGYGDCKALSNYMVSLLAEAGIKSYYTLVYAGSKPRKLREDLPSQQFNHIIVCVPMSADTMWLECTNQIKQPGYLGSFTANRRVLLISEESGGEIASTPCYKLNDNLQARVISAELRPDNQLNLQSVTRYTGEQQDKYHDLIHTKSEKEQGEYLSKAIDMPHVQLTKFSYSEGMGDRFIPFVKESLEIVTPNYAQQSGKRIFINPNILSRSYRRYTTDSRKDEIFLYYSYVDIDSVSIKVPSGYKAESTPKPQKITTDFGSFECSYTFNGQEIIYYRKQVQEQGLFPATRYGELKTFYDAIYKADRYSFVLVKEE